ncbi:MAG: ATP-binding protein [Hyphomicrobiaceae bacterium]|nr:ATP-binding protein [Hyphomicrobiaceae bacterium]
MTASKAESSRSDFRSAPAGLLRRVLSVATGRAVVDNAGLAAVLLGLALLPPPFGTAQVLLALGAFLLARRGLTPSASAPGSSVLPVVPDTVPRAAEPDAGAMAERLEDLQDLRWELSASEARYRELIEAQDDVIIQHDDEGRIAFANAAFLRTFAAADGLSPGRADRDRRLSGTLAPAIAAAAAAGQCLELATGAGMRRFAWRRYVLPPAADGTPRYESIGRDVTAEHAAAIELERARVASEAANRAKSRFLATMSHEIRTPMNGILGMTHLLADTNLSAEQATYTDAIDHSARTLLALIDEILDFSKIEAGKLVLEAAPFDIAATIRSCTELMARRAHDKGLDLAWRVAPDVPSIVIGDETRCRQIVLNLLSNAIKFTDTGGVSVTLAVRPQQAGDTAGVARLVLSVRDTGIGLAPEAQSLVFAEFEQADGSDRRRHGGTGLGLAITSRVVRAMQGEIAVDSRLGEGATFSVTLPLCLPQRAIAAPGSRARAELAAALRRAPPRVLVVAEAGIERDGLVATLADHGIWSAASTWQAAFAAVEDARAAGQDFDRLIVRASVAPLADDVARAGELLRCAASGPLRRGCLGLVIAGPHERRRIEEFKRAGFAGYLLRPLRPESLLAQLSAPGSPTEMPGASEAPARQSVSSAEASSHDQPARSSAATVSRVLLVEDNPVNRLLAERVLAKAGIATTTAACGEDALAAMTSARRGSAPMPDAILMDICMPGLDGVETAARIRTLFEDGRCPPIIALTAHAFPEDRERYLASGLDGYLAKPFEPAALIAVLADALGRRVPGAAA